MVFIEKGFSNGNHTTSHTSLTSLPVNARSKEIDTTNKLIEKIIYDPIKLFRSPYCSLNEKIQENINNQSLKTIMWNRDPQEWDLRNTNANISNVLNTDPSGSIYLFHEIDAIVKALPTIIENFYKQGLKIVCLK